MLAKFPPKKKKNPFHKCLITGAMKINQNPKTTRAAKRPQKTEYINLNMDLTNKDKATLWPKKKGK